jgi:hypothetical protein
MHFFGERPDFLGTHAHILREGREGRGHRFELPCNHAALGGVMKHLTIGVSDSS